MELPNDQRSRWMLRMRRGWLTQIAETCGITRGAVAKWKRVPEARVLDVEAATGISRYDLRPDLYPPPLEYGHSARHAGFRARSGS